jgi:hypothetical protein
VESNNLLSHLPNLAEVKLEPGAAWMVIDQDWLEYMLGDGPNVNRSFLHEMTSFHLQLKEGWVELLAHGEYREIKAAIYFEMHCRIDKLYRARINLTVNNALPEGGNIAMAYKLYDEAKTGEEFGEAWLFKKNSE